MPDTRRDGEMLNLLLKFTVQDLVSGVSIQVSGLSDANC
jgi:hypothetical protein